jgi:hypothetical protein
MASQIQTINAKIAKNVTLTIFKNLRRPYNFKCENKAIVCIVQLLYNEGL